MKRKRKNGSPTCTICEPSDLSSLLAFERKKPLEVSNKREGRYSFSIAFQLIGSFCAIDSKPHSWTEDDLVTLRDLSKVAEAYTALGGARRAETAARPTGSESGHGRGDPMHAISTGIRCATRILQRGDERMSETERALLLRIVKYLSQERASDKGAFPLSRKQHPPGYSDASGQDMIAVVSISINRSGRQRMAWIPVDAGKGSSPCWLKNSVRISLKAA